MPSTWNRAPEDFHKIYVENTESFYRSAGRYLKKDLSGRSERLLLPVSIQVCSDHPDIQYRERAAG